MNRLISCFCALLSCSAIGYAGEEPRLDQQIAAATNALLQSMAQQAGGKTYSIAAIPLVDPARTPPAPRKLGVRIADGVTTALIAAKRDWLRVQDRVQLPSVLKEQRLWIADFAKKGKGAAPEGIERADLLVVGTTTVDGDTVHVSLRVVNIAGEAVAAQQFDLDAASVRPLLAFPERTGSGTGDLAAVSNIEVKLTAQRKKGIGGNFTEWVPKPGEALKCADQFSMSISPDADAYVYVFIYSSDGTADVLLPTDAWLQQYQRAHRKPAQPDSNLFRAELPYSVPGCDDEGTQLFFTLGNIPCRNVLYIAASRSTVPDYRAIPRRLLAAKTAADRLTLLDQTFKFDFVKMVEFAQE